MNIIHSSSLAYSPVAYNKSQTGTVDSATASAINNGGQDHKPNSRPSSSEQIKAALDSAGLSNDNNYNLPGNTRTQKALTAYTQTGNQSAHLRVAELISGIDLYA